MALKDYFERLGNITGEGTRASDFDIMRLERNRAKQEFIKNLQLQQQRNLQFNAFAPPGQTPQQTGFPEGTGNFSGKLSMYPIKGGRMSSNYGPRKHPIHGKTSNHTGIDWAAPAGTPIYAPGSGTIRSAKFHKIYGNQSILDLGGGYSLMFGHQSGFNVKPGQRVQAGQVIGYVGSTGWSTGPHLHFETWYNNTPVNPLSWFK